MILSKLAISSVRALASTLRPSIQETTRQFTQRPNLYGKTITNPTFHQSRRYYSAGRNQVRHPRPERWPHDVRKGIVLVALGSGVVIYVFSGNSETIPYTKRNHFVLLSRNAEKKLGKREFRNVKKKYKRKILPKIHPESVRVRSIAKDVIEALHRGIKQDKVWVDGGSEKKEFKKREVATTHLDGLDWEVLVVDEPVVNAFCLPGGKIVVFTGLLKHCSTDAEIATILGHEVGHVVARHSAEQITKNMWVALIEILVAVVTMHEWDPRFIETIARLLLKFPFSRRMEKEADYIGLLLIASAGYDPQIAPKVYEKLGQVCGNSPLNDYLSTHPSGKTRAKVLSQAKVMEEALTIYRDAREGRMVHDFLEG